MGQIRFSRRTAATSLEPAATTSSKNECRYSASSCSRTLTVKACLRPRRLFDAQTDYYHIVTGLKGDFDNGYTYNAAYNYNRYDQVQFTRNAINGAALDLALQPNGQTDPATGLPLSKLPSTGPLNVPVYNIFAGSKDAADGRSRSGQNNAATLEGIRTTLFQSGTSEEWDASGSITGTPFDLPGGQLGFAVGGGFFSEGLLVDFDG